MDKELLINGIKYRRVEDSCSNLPRTYKEALQLFDGTIYCKEYDLVDSMRSNKLESGEFNYPFSTNEGTCHKLIAFEKLIFLRDIYRQDWKPDYSNSEVKFTIQCFNNDIQCGSVAGSSKVLSFQSKEIRDKFLENFRSLINECIEFI